MTKEDIDGIVNHINEARKISEENKLFMGSTVIVADSLEQLEEISRLTGIEAVTEVFDDEKDIRRVCYHGIEFFEFIIKEEQHEY